MFGNKDTKDAKDSRDIRETREVRETTPTPTPIASRIHDRRPSSVIGEGMVINGIIKVEGTLTIHGEVEGSITCTDQLVVGKSGRVKADLNVGGATIGGWVEGRIFARERVELETSSHLKGDVHSKSFVIQDGCFFQGNCTMGEAHDASRHRLTVVEEPKEAKIEKAA